MNTAPLDVRCTKVRILLVMLVFAGVVHAFAACAPRASTTEDAELFPERIVVPPCVGPLADIQLLAVKRDPFKYKPSRDVEHLLVDLHVLVHDPQELWLLVDYDTFPTGVSDVTETRDGTWYFTGNASVSARWLGRSSDANFKDVHVTTTSSRYGRRHIAVILGTIDIEGMSPQRWVAQGGQNDHRTTYGRELVPSSIDVLCATWFELRVEADAGAQTNP